MSPSLIPVFALLGAALAALLGWIGNHHIQNHVYGFHLRKDALRNSLYEFLDLTSGYWNSNGTDARTRKSMEARIVVAQSVISAEYGLLAKRYKTIKRSYDSTKALRIVLWDAATGGRFQQEDWEPDPERSRAVSNAVIGIVNSLG